MFFLPANSPEIIILKHFILCKEKAISNYDILFRNEIYY